MKTFRYAFLLLMFGFIGIGAIAQNTGSGPAPTGQHNDQVPEEKIKALKIAFLTNALNLTAAEAQAFWPLYNEYEDKKMGLHKTKMNHGKKLQTNLDQISDTEVNKILDEYIAAKQKLTNLEVEYLQKFRKVLPPKKIALLQKAERDFKMEVLKEYKNRDEGGPNSK